MGKWNLIDCMQREKGLFLKTDYDKMGGVLKQERELLFEIWPTHNPHHLQQKGSCVQGLLHHHGNSGFNHNTASFPHPDNSHIAHCGSPV